MAAQANRDWTWVILLDKDDPLKADREEAFRSAGIPCLFLYWRPGIGVESAPWDRRGGHTLQQKIAATAYRVEWGKAIGAGQGTILQTRIDDDDGFAPSALGRLRYAADRLNSGVRLAWMFPVGIRVWDGNYSRVIHRSNAMHSLQTPPGDTKTVYDYGHRLVRRVAPVRVVDKEIAWLWARHRDTISGWKLADEPLTDAVRALFPVDWSKL
jgi:hypothetical protein